MLVENPKVPPVGLDGGDGGCSSRGSEGGAG